MSTPLAPLASLSQVEQTPSREDGIPADLEEELRTYGCKLIQQAGILLKQQQVAMSTAQVLYQRFWYVSSMKQFSITDICMGALYLASKLEEYPIRMRDLINVFHILISRASHLLKAHTAASSSSTLPSKADPIPEFKYTPMGYFDDPFYELKDAMVVAEMQILKRLGFHVTVKLPYGTLVSYMNLLELSDRQDANQMAWGYLNDALQTPVYALYSIPTIVAAAIFLSTRHLRIPLPADPPNCWWELFDVHWDDLWSVSGRIMSLYRPRAVEDCYRPLGLLHKKDIRKWLESHPGPISDAGS